MLVIGRCSRECRENMAETARAFGAAEIAFTGPEDRRLKCMIAQLNSKWGGRFEVAFISDYMRYIDSKISHKKVCLTRYGTPASKLIYTLKAYKNLLVIITMKEAGKRISSIADFSMSITAQPHSGASALAVFLHMFYEGRELALHFENAKYKIPRR
ncbi:MAG: hypothetical protein ACP5UH_01405 [Candidatus Micrarchaeia archaeon]